ncbi:MAG: hypothetical protein EKK52_17250 [Burkholderiales bacterium]|uniref:hypothetical protein n=1 Tax=Roseateles sp. TaxID=1971397 RepID=UPI000F9BAAE1|nr:MAG: hypothetical protein EKK52_17250 [Burkholderiales bacterium]
MTTGQRLPLTTVLAVLVQLAACASEPEQTPAQRYTVDAARCERQSEIRQQMSMAAFPVAVLKDVVIGNDRNIYAACMAAAGHPVQAVPAQPPTRPQPATPASAPRQ